MVNGTRTWGTREQRQQTGRSQQEGYARRGRWSRQRVSREGILHGAGTRPQLGALVRREVDVALLALGAARRCWKRAYSTGIDVIALPVKVGLMFLLLGGFLLGGGRWRQLVRRFLAVAAGRSCAARARGGARNVVESDSDGYFLWRVLVEAQRSAI